MTLRLVVVALLTVHVPCDADYGPLSNEDGVLIARLKRSFWRASLSELERSQVLAGLRSKDSRVVRAAVPNALAHRVEAALPILREWGKRSRLMAVYAESFGPQENIVGRLRVRLRRFPAVIHRHGGPHEWIRDMIVMLAARQRRLGAPPRWIGRVTLSRYHENLLAFSAKPEKDAIDALVRKLSRLDVITGAYFRVLQTYGMPGIEAVIDHLENSDAVRASTEHGVLALFSAIGWQVRILPDDMHERLAAVAKNLSTSRRPKVARRARGFANLLASQR